MRYCGIAFGPGFLQLATLEEVLVDEPPVRLRATFYEPGDVEQVVAAIRGLGDVVVGIGAPAGENRQADRELAARGVPPLPYSAAAARLYDDLDELGVYAPSGAGRQGQGGAVRTAAELRAA